MADASQKGLQLLVDSFAGTDDTEERDDLLQDIIYVRAVGYRSNGTACTVGNGTALCTAGEAP